MTYFIIVGLIISASSVYINADLVLGLLFIIGFYLIYSFGSELIVNLFNSKIERVFKRFYIVFTFNLAGLKNLINLINECLRIFKYMWILNYSLIDFLKTIQYNNLKSLNNLISINNILWIKNWVYLKDKTEAQKSAYNIFLINKLVDLIYLNSVKIELYKKPNIV